MKRRTFGVLAGSSLVSVSTFAMANTLPINSPPGLLGAGLTPMGSERAGNADGSIPAWTGGLVASPLLPIQPVDVQLFTNERPLNTLDAGNMARYGALLSPGTHAMMRRFGFRIKQYQTHRTAAAPQYVYDNTAENVTRSELSPQGAQLGFFGAYSGVPFPIINTVNPLVGGAQLIWNHLTTWEGYAGWTNFLPTFVVVDGKLMLSAASSKHFTYPFYDQSGSIKTFDGYYIKMNLAFQAPVTRQEIKVWHSTNVGRYPELAWMYWSDADRARRIMDKDYYEKSNAAAGQIANFDENSCFCGSPVQYDWRYIVKQEMLVPYNCNAMHFCDAQDILGAKYPDPDVVRWEKHRVWVVEGTLRPGQNNKIVRRRFYIDEDSWCALLGEGYDARGALVKFYTVYNRCVPSIPAVRKLGSLVYDLRTGNYVFAGSINYKAYVATEFISPQDPHLFEPQERPASCGCF